MPINIKRTIEVLGYDPKPDKRRRTRAEEALHEEILGYKIDRKRNLPVISNCPLCDKERKIELKSAKKDKPCLSCVQGSIEMREMKRKANLGRKHTDEAKAKMKVVWAERIENGYVPQNKGVPHTDKVKEHLANKTKEYLASLPPEELERRYIKASCTVRGIPIEEFDGFNSNINTRLREHREAKKWRQEVAEKFNNTCVVSGAKNDIEYHHLDNFIKYPDKRYDVHNGVTLNKDIHKLFHCIYGSRDNTKEHFEDFVSSIENKTLLKKSLTIHYSKNNHIIAPKSNEPIIYQGVKYTMLVDLYKPIKDRKERYKHVQLFENIEEYIDIFDLFFNLKLKIHK